MVSEEIYTKGNEVIGDLLIRLIRFEAEVEICAERWGFEYEEE